MARLTAAEAALEWLRDRRVSRFYGGEINQWLRLGPG